MALLVGCGLIIGNAILIRLDQFQCFDRVGDRFIISIWIGVLVLANSFLLLSLFLPLSFPVNVSATLLLLGFSLWSQQSRHALAEMFRQPSPGFLLGIISLALGVAAYCSQVIVWYDSGLYHMQVIKWLSEFGLVPGLALIHSRFGFISSWFSLPALFNHGILQGRISALPGALCLFLLLGHSLVAFVRIVGQHARSQDVFIFAASLLAVPVILFWGLPNSPSPDFPVIVLVMVVAWSLLAISNRKTLPNLSGGPSQVTIVPLLLAVGALSIKLSALPLVAVAGSYYLFHGELSLKKAAIAASLAALPLALLAVTGIVTSGCAFYPAQFLCTDAPWSLGSASAAAESRIIRDWARWGGLTPENATTWNWILPWFQTEKICAALISLSLLAALGLVTSRANIILKQKGYVIAIGLTGAAFMLYSAPTWRFGLGYLVVLPALAVALRANSYSPLLKGFHRMTHNFGAIGIIVAAALALHVHVMPRPSYRLLDEAIAKGIVDDKDHPHFNLLFPPRIWNIGYVSNPTTGKVDAFENTIVQNHAGNIIYYRPEESDTCWDAPLPCSPAVLKNIRLRQPPRGLSGGVEKLSSGLRKPLNISGLLRLTQ